MERIREGETGYRDFTLSDQNGVYNGTGTTIELVLTDRNGGVVDTTGKVSWLVAADGTARVSLAAGDLQAYKSPYQARFIVTASGLTYPFPSSGPDEWQVWK